MSIKSPINGISASKYIIFYRDIIKALRFLIGHKDFTHDLASTLIWQYAVSSLEEPDFLAMEEQVYDEIHIADWWWETQEALKSDGIKNATIVPVLLAGDKIQFGTIAGDMTLWPIYFTIENLNHEVRQ